MANVDTMRLAMFGHGKGKSLLKALVLIVCLAAPGYGQQGEIPPAPVIGTVSDDPAAAANPQRIVEGRPNLYGVRQYLHPVSWFEAGAASLLNVTQKAVPQRKPFNPSSGSKPPKASGFKISLRGLGAGSGFGPDVKPFHDNVFGSGVRVEFPFLLTYRFYEFAGARANYPLLSSGGVDRVDLDFTADYTSRPSDNFFGIGNDSLESNQTQFRSVTRGLTTALDTRISGHWTVRLAEEYRNIGITAPRDYVSTSDVFPAADVPGLANGGGVILTTRAILERHAKDRPYVPTSGGYQRIAVSSNDGIGSGDIGYWTYEAEGAQFFSLSKDHRKVISVRAQIETNQPKGGSIVPFFVYPTLGGNSTLRGFNSRRFTDTSAMSVSVGYRYRIWRYLDWGLFLDSGQVAPEIGDFGWSSFHHGYGFQLIGHDQGRRAVRLSVGFSDERAWMFYVDINPAF